MRNLRNILYSTAMCTHAPLAGMKGILDVEYDYESVASAFSKHPLQDREQNIWRYKELLPVSADIARPHLFVGWTPVYDIPRLAKAFGIRQLFLKDDGRNPTNSFKDRASSVGVLKSIEFGFDEIACASTGNAASSLAGLSAATGLKSYIFVPERAPEPKVTQLLDIRSHGSPRAWHLRTGIRTLQSCLRKIRMVQPKQRQPTPSWLKERKPPDWK